CIPARSLASPLTDQFAPFAEFLLTCVRLVAHVRIRLGTEHVTWTIRSPASARPRSFSNHERHDVPAHNDHGVPYRVCDKCFRLILQETKLVRLQRNRTLPYPASQARRQFAQDDP